jgi:hypothetical protein
VRHERVIEVEHGEGIGGHDRMAPGKIE